MAFGGSEADTRGPGEAPVTIKILMPFAVAVNCFDGARRCHPEDVRSALDLDPQVPVVLCDARQRSSARDVLIALIEHALRRLQRAHTAGTNV